MKKPVKHRDARSGTFIDGGKTPRKTTAAKKAAAAPNAGKGTMCFDGAGDLHPARSKAGQPKKR
jgi:hypothetical protein